MIRLMACSIVLSLGVSQLAFARNVAKSGSWKLDIITNNGVNQCVAYTTGDRDGLELTLGVYVNQNSGQPLEVILTGKTRNAVTPGLFGGFTSGGMIQAAVLADNPKSLIYWGLGRKTAEMVSALKAMDKIKFLSQSGGVKPVAFELDGFTAMITEMEKRCNGSKSFSKPAFESAFLQGVPETVLESQFDKSKTTSLRALLFQGHKQFLAVEATNQELTQLRAKYGADLDRAEVLDNRIKLLQGRLIPDTQVAISDKQKFIADSQNDLQSVIASIPGLDAAIPPLQQDYDQKKAILDQVAPEYLRLEGVANSARTRLASARSDLATSRTKLNNNLSEQNRLTGVANQLDADLNSYQFERNSALSDLRQAQSELDRFDFRWEYDQRLRRDWSYNRAQNEVSRLEQESYQANSDVNRLRAERNQISQARAQCQATPGADCADLIAREQAANAALDAAKDRERRVNSDLYYARNEVERIERRVENEVRSIQTALIDRKNKAQLRVDNLNTRIRNAQMERDSIRNSQLPGLRSEESSLRARISQLQLDIPGYESALARAESDLSSYDGSSGYTSKKQASDQALARLRSAQAAARNAKDRKAQLERSIASAQTEQQALQNQLAAYRAELAKCQSDLAGLQTVLNKYRAEKAPIDQKLATQQSAFDSTRAEYLRTLPAATN